MVLAALILGIGAFDFNQQYAQQTTYTNIKGDGVETAAVVGPVDVEYARGRAQHTFGKYITWTTASISYVVHGRTLESDIRASRSMRRPLDAKTLYPPLAWSTGEQVVLYVDPVRPERFVVFHEFKEEDAESIPRGAVVVMISTGAALLLPMVLIIAGSRHVSKARRL